MGKANFNFLCCCSVFHSILFRSFWSRSLLYCILVFVYSCFGFSCFLCVCLPSLRFSIRIAWWFSLRYVCMRCCFFFFSTLSYILFYRKNPFRPFTLLFFCLFSLSLYLIHFTFVVHLFHSLSLYSQVFLSQAHDITHSRERKREWDSNADCMTSVCIITLP